jgi:extradiol dioxygenase family protein
MNLHAEVLGMQAGRRQKSWLMSLLYGSRLPKS